MVISKIGKAVRELLLDKGITISMLLNKLELDLPIKKRCRYDFEAQIKLVLFFELKKFKSHHKLFEYLANNETEALQIGFDKTQDNKINLPSRRAFSKFIKNLNTDYKNLIKQVTSETFVVADELGIVLDTVQTSQRILKEAISKKTTYNLKEERIEQLIREISPKIYRKLKLKMGKNASYDLKSFIDELIYIAFSQDFLEGGHKAAKKLFNKRFPSPDTLFYHLKKFKDYKELQPMFFEIIDYLLNLAKKTGIITDRQNNLAIDSHEWFYYGSYRTTQKIVGKKPERGARFCYKFITIDLVSSRSRFTLAALPILMDDENEMTDLVIDLITHAKQNIRIRYVLMDRGFISSNIINAAERLQIKVLMPAKENLRSVRTTKSIAAPFIIPDLLMGHCRITLIGIEREGIRREFITNVHFSKDEIKQAAKLAKYFSELYRDRWMIESNYRTKKYAFRGKTCSKNYVIRYFYFMLSIVLFDFWVLLDLGVILYLGLKTKWPIITAKLLSITILTMSIKEPSG